MSKKCGARWGKTKPMNRRKPGKTGEKLATVFHLYAFTRVPQRPNVIFDRLRLHDLTGFAGAVLPVIFKPFAQLAANAARVSGTCRCLSRQLASSSTRSRSVGRPPLAGDAGSRSHSVSSSTRSRSWAAARVNRRRRACGRRISDRRLGLRRQRSWGCSAGGRPATGKNVSKATLSSLMLLA